VTRRLLPGAGLAAVAVLLVTGCGSSPSPRPDIVFVSSRDGDYALYGMNAGGSRQKRLTHEQGDSSTPEGLFFQVEPSWSPDGSKIAFSSKRDGPSHIFVMRADGSKTRRLTDTKLDDGNPSWSPNGASIAFDRGGDLFVMSADGTAARRVVNDQALETDPDWSPDGRWLVYVRKVGGTTIRELWLVHPDGTRRRKLVRLGVSSESPAWSPDGRRIAFSSDAGGAATDIYEVGLNGKAPRRITISGGTGAFEPDWSPDGKSVAYWREGSIYVLDVGGGQEQLTNGEGNDSSPMWRPAIS
jgi:Tol biopolymer transport system component